MGKIVVLLVICASLLTFPIKIIERNIFWELVTWVPERQKIVTRLNAIAGKHLVLVRYNNPSIIENWVYNQADIDAAKIVWARDMGEKKNTRLFEYFYDRRIWLIDIG